MAELTVQRWLLLNVPGGSNEPYNRFYAAMKSWGRYELVASPADADWVFEIRFTAPLVDSGTTAML